ncbi:hypothetical protein KAH94_03525 [bacterium]|nr:hypothetical protein [bacterium]
MKIQRLHSTFSNAIGWNAFLFIIQKTLFISLSLLLYKNLTTRDFSLWANINSIIFLLLLWLDFGFRKSLPRFAPEFAKNSFSMRKFIQAIFLFQGGILLIAMPLFYFLAPKFAQSIGLGQSIKVLYLGSILFFVEGLVAIVRLVFHSYFWQKQFNLVASAALTIQMGINLVLISFLQKNSSMLVQSIFLVKIIIGTIIFLISLWNLKKLYEKKLKQIKNESVTVKKSDFIKHSGLMWVNNSIKSLTERNFLVPLFTYTFGPATANLFKIANDGALFFQRIVIKTIGTTDTSLLAHIEAKSAKNEDFSNGFNVIIRKTTSFCIPIVVIAFIFAPKFLGLFYQPQASKLFFILLIGYLAHALLSPYERVLEVKRDYTTLLLAYIPYVFLIFSFLWFNLLTCIGLTWSIITIQTVRLVSVLISLLCTIKRYKLPFPYKFALSLFGITLVSCLLIFTAIKLI